MRKKTLFPSMLVLVTAVIFLVSACMPQAPIGDPGRLRISGVAVTPPRECFLDFDMNPDITEGLPLPNALVLIEGDMGSELETTTDMMGRFEFSGVPGEAYLVYVNLGDIWVKKAVVDAVGGEANFYTTSQVIIFEVAQRLFPGELEIRDIPGLEPTDELVEAVQAVLADCRDAQVDPGVLAIAEDLVNTMFRGPAGAPIAPTTVPEAPTAPDQPDPVPDEPDDPPPPDDGNNGAPPPPPPPGAPGIPETPGAPGVPGLPS